MRKSDKKFVDSNLVKSDRIEALRKKFEAFLDEDKKRKERNEYILGKLDKMCTCTALVPQHKSNLVGNAHGTILYGRQVPFLDRCNFLRNLSASSAPANYIPQKPESQIIDEIFQKFILIPKNIRSVTDTDRLPRQHNASVVNEDDWKSKYEILNQLLETEKDEPIKLAKELPSKDEKEFLNENTKVISTPRTQTQPESQILDNHKKPVPQDYKPIQLSHALPKEESNPQKLNEPAIQALNENVNYDIADELKFAGTIEQIESNLYPNKDNNINQVNEEISGDGNNEVSQHDQPKNLVFTTTPAHTEVQNDFTKISNVYNDYDEKGLEYENYDYQETQESIVNDNTNTDYLQDNGFSSVDVHSPSEVINELSNEVQHNTKSNEQSQPPQNTINSINPEQLTPNDGVILEDAVNINSEGYEAINNYGTVSVSGNVDSVSGPVLEQGDAEENIEAKGIEEFEAEQNDMWHAQPNVGEGVIYNQEAAEAYPNEAYDQNQYYYEQGQEYPVQVNEHEETQLKYDQNYQQQYVENYESEYQPDAQQYETQAYQEGYEAAPVYDRYNQEEYNQYQQQLDVTPQTIEKELDNEQGYVETNAEPPESEKEAPASDVPKNNEPDLTETK